MRRQVRVRAGGPDSPCAGLPMRFNGLSRCGDPPRFDMNLLAQDFPASVDCRARGCVRLPCLVDPCPRRADRVRLGTGGRGGGPRSHARRPAMRAGSVSSSFRNASRPVSTGLPRPSRCWAAANCVSAMSTTRTRRPATRSPGRPRTAGGWALLPNSTTRFPGGRWGCPSNGRRFMPTRCSFAPVVGGSAFVAWRLEDLRRASWRSALWASSRSRPGSCRGCPTRGDWRWGSLSDPFSQSWPRPTPRRTRGHGWSSRASLAGSICGSACRPGFRSSSASRWGPSSRPSSPGWPPCHGARGRGSGAGPPLRPISRIFSGPLGVVERGADPSALWPGMDRPRRTLSPGRRRGYRVKGNRGFCATISWRRLPRFYWLQSRSPCGRPAARASSTRDLEWARLAGLPGSPVAGDSGSWLSHDGMTPAAWATLLPIAALLAAAFRRFARRRPPGPARPLRSRSVPRWWPSALPCASWAGGQGSMPASWPSSRLLGPGRGRCLVQAHAGSSSPRSLSLRCRGSPACSRSGCRILHGPHAGGIRGARGAPPRPLARAAHRRGGNRGLCAA